MVARETRGQERRQTPLVATIGILFDTWRHLLGRPLAPLSRAGTSVARAIRMAASDLRHAISSGVDDASQARRLVWIGLLAFGAGVILSTMLTGRTGRMWVPVAESAAWMVWLIVRLMVMRIVVRPRRGRESASVTGAWALGMLPFVLALEYYSSAVVGWLGSAIATWWVMKQGPTGPEDARRAVLAFLALEVAALMGLTLLRNLSVIGLLLTG